MAFRNFPGGAASLAISVSKRDWFSGRTSASQALGTSSILVSRTSMENEKKLMVDVEGAPHEAIVGASVFRDRTNEEGKTVREVLLVKGEKSGQWYFLGGKIREGEDLVEALRRELREELGLDFKGTLRASGEDVGYYTFGGKDRAIANFVLHEEDLIGEPKLQDNENVVDFGWFADPFTLNLTEQTRAVLEKQMQG